MEAAIGKAKADADAERQRADALAIERDGLKASLADAMSKAQREERGRSKADAECAALQTALAREKAIRLPEHVGELREKIAELTEALERGARK